MVKTFKKLYERICSKEKLYLAYEKAKKGKTKNKSVIEFAKNLDENIAQLHNELVNFNYNPSPLKRFIIRDPKTRVIHSSHFRDRVVHHALINALGPIFEPRFIYDSYANRKGKGTLAAVKRFDYFKQRMTKNGKLVLNYYTSNSVVGYVLKADIKHFFDTVNHEVLISIINYKVKDNKVIWLIQGILNNLPERQISGKSNKGIGMPLGNYTSQFFANIYLTRLDHFIKHKLKAKYYIRYVDDFVMSKLLMQKTPHFSAEMNATLSIQKFKTNHTL